MAAGDMFWKPKVIRLCYGKLDGHNRGGGTGKQKFIDFAYSIEARYLYTL
jgi:hypothetical protein